MKYLTFKISLLSILIFLPFITLSQNGLVPCLVTECDFNDLITMANNILIFLIILAIPLSVIAFSYAGFLYLTAGGDEGKIKSAHGVFTSVAIGLFFVISAWLIVYFLTSQLVSDDITGILESVE